MSNRSKKFVFLPFCVLAQAYQAQGIVKYEWKSSIKPIVDLLLENNINIIQMPCAEAEFNSRLVRDPQGISKYDNQEFNNHCQKLADKVAKQIRDIILAGYEIVAVLGIEQSPSCCVNYIYTNKGMVNRKGLFMERLYFNIKDLNIPFIGINRGHVNKSLQQLNKLL